MIIVVSGLNGSLEQLAERADRVIDACLGYVINAVDAQPDRDRLLAMEDAVRALLQQIAVLLSHRETG